MFGGRVFQQIVGIPMGSNWTLLLADLFLYSYKTTFIQGLPKKTKNASPILQYHVPLYRGCPFTK